MVLTQHRGFRFSFAVDDGAGTLNSVRILVTAAALALHAAVFLVIVAPVAMPPKAAEEIRIRMLPDVRKKEDPPPQPPPDEVPIEQPRTTPKTATPERTTTPDIPIVTDRVTDAYTPDIADAGPVAPVGIDIAPPSPVYLEYVDAPPPAYPRAAQAGRREGQVMLRVTVGADGVPTAVEIAQSSGHRDLDAAARAQVLKHWRFRPAMKDGQAIPAIGMVPINFQLN